MIVKSDQDQVRALLTEAITVLCKKRLSFKSQLSVEGLIGITLDADDIFLVSIKELILQGEEEETHLVGETQMSTPVSVSSSCENATKARSGRQRKSTPRHLSVVSPPLKYSVADQPEEEEDECSWLLQDGTDIDNLSPVTAEQNHVNGYTEKTNTTATTNTSGTKNDMEVMSNGVQENGIDAPLNLSSTSSHPVPAQPTIKVEDKPHRDITPQKRKRYDSGDTDSQCSSVLSGSIKRPSSVSNISSLSPARTTPTLELVSIKQEPTFEPAYNNNHFNPHTNGYLFIQPAHEKSDMLTKSFGNGVMKDTGNILAGRTNLIESAIWQRLASPITPLQLSSPLMPSQANFVCPKCGRHMQHLGGWTRHVERCGMPRLCNACGKHFKTSNSLRVHRFHYHRTAQPNAKTSSKTSLRRSSVMILPGPTAPASVSVKNVAESSAANDRVLDNVLKQQRDHGAIGLQMTSSTT